MLLTVPWTFSSFLGISCPSTSTKKGKVSETSSPRRKASVKGLICTVLFIMNRKCPLNVVEYRAEKFACPHLILENGSIRAAMMVVLYAQRSKAGQRESLIG